MLVIRSRSRRPVSRSCSIFGVRSATLSTLALALAAACTDGTEPTGVANVARPAASVAAVSSGPTRVRFDSAASYTVAGAATNIGDALRLTGGEWQQGSAWLATKQTLANGFEAKFDFKITGLGCEYGDGDGMAFVIQDFDAAAAGGFGSDLGYAGIPRAVAVEFDTYNSGDDYGESSANHIALMTRGVDPLSANHAYALTTVPAPVTLADHETHAVRITYAAGAFELFLDGSATPLISVPLDLTNVGGASILDANGKAWVGFTAGTGAACSNHDVFLAKNSPPTADAGTAYTADEGVELALDGGASSDPNGDALTYAWDLDADGQYDDASVAQPTHTFADDGAYAVGLVVTDALGEADTASAVVTVRNVAPTATFAATPSVSEGGTIQLSMTHPADVPADLASLSYAFDCGSGFGAFSGATAASCPQADNTPAGHPLTVRSKVSDGDGGETEYTAQVAVENVAPTLLGLSGPMAPIELTSGRANAALTFSFGDPAVSADTYTATIRCGDGQVVVAQGLTSPATAACSYATAGVYTVRATLSDEDGGTSAEQVYQFVVVYDPSAGSVSGGGWVDSDGRDCARSLCGGGADKVTFGFHARYLPGNTTPTGNVELQFHVASLNFKSTSYESLILASNRAQFWGAGTVNGAAGYTFRITAVDDDAAGDRLRIEIWNAAGAAVYDNDGGAPRGALPSTPLGGGNIAIKR